MKLNNAIFIAFLLFFSTSVVANSFFEIDVAPMENGVQNKITVRFSGVQECERLPSLRIGIVYHYSEYFIKNVVFQELKKLEDCTGEIVLENVHSEYCIQFEIERYMFLHYPYIGSNWYTIRQWCVDDDPLVV